MSRKQCAKCPWKKDVNPFDIPEYDIEWHRNLDTTICDGFMVGGLRMMSCHEFKVGEELPCVGWMHNQLGVGNNITLRLAVVEGRVDPSYELVGEQHACFEDTLPEER